MSQPNAHSAIKLTASTASRAAATFEFSIKDAEALLALASSHPPPPNSEVFKRAGLVMALTSWETYVEDCLLEAVSHRYADDPGYPAQFLLAKLKEELNRLHNPTSDKTRNLFDEYLCIDVKAHWQWSGFDAAKACERLDALMKKRGDAVHRARPASAGPTPPHLVSKDELEKAIRFIKELVAATERSLAGVS